jgi:hypothetical protein
VFPFIAGIIVVIAARFGYITWLRAVQQKDSILVLMPDGLVQCTHYHTPEKHEYKVLSYAAIASMTFRRIDTSTGTTKNMYIIRVAYGIDITYKDGVHEQWTFDKRFGPSRDMARMVVQAYEHASVEQTS